MRPVFIAIASAACASGMAVEYVLGNLMPWRDSLLIYAAITLGAFSFTFLVGFQSIFCSIQLRINIKNANDFSSDS